MQKCKIYFLFTAFIFVSCSKVTELEVETDRRPILGSPSQLVIKRTGSSNFQINKSGEDKVNYYLLGDERNVVEETNETNTGCRGNEIHIQSDGVTTDTYHRDILFTKDDNGEIFVSIDCYPRVFKITALDSVINVRLVVEDQSNENIRDTVAFSAARSR